MKRSSKDESNREAGKSLPRFSLQRSVILIALVISLGQALIFLSTGRDDLDFPGVHDLAPAIFLISSGVLILVSLFLLLLGERFDVLHFLRFQRDDWRPWGLTLVVLAIMTSLITGYVHSCCAIDHLIRIGFPLPLFTIICTSNKVLPASALLPWPFIYGQIASYVQQNAPQHPELFVWSVTGNLFSNLIFCAHGSVLLLVLMKTMKHLFSFSAPRKSL